MVQPKIFDAPPHFRDAGPAWQSLAGATTIDATLTAPGFELVQATVIVEAIGPELDHHLRGFDPRRLSPRARDQGVIRRAFELNLVPLSASTLCPTIGATADSASLSLQLDA